MRANANEARFIVSTYRTADGKLINKSQLLNLLGAGAFVADLKKAGLKDVFSTPSPSEASKMPVPPTAFDVIDTETGQSVAKEFENTDFVIASEHVATNEQQAEQPVVEVAKPARKPRARKPKKAPEAEQPVV